MDNPFLPALLIFGPFFLLLFFFTLTRAKGKENSVEPNSVSLAIGASLLIGVLGGAVVFTVWSLNA